MVIPKEKTHCKNYLYELIQQFGVWKWKIQREMYFELLKKPSEKGGR